MTGSTNQISARSQFGLPPLVWVAFFLGIVAAAGAYLATGATLGLFFGGILFATLLVPPLSLAEDRLIYRLLIAGAVNDGIGLVWLLAVLTPQITLVQWLLCYVVLLVWCFALAGVASAIQRLVKNEIPASAIAVVLALLWLSWPIWLARFLPDHQRVVPYLVAPHPLMATNGILKNLGIWSERPLAYRSLMTLGQDVPYALPRSIVPVVIIHLLIGSLVFVGRTTAGKR